MQQNALYIRNSFILGILLHFKMTIKLNVKHVFEMLIFILITACICLHTTLVELILLDKNPEFSFNLIVSLENTVLK